MVARFRAAGLVLFLFDNIDGLSRDAAVSTFLSLRGQAISDFGESNPSSACIVTGKPRYHKIGRAHV